MLRALTAAGPRLSLLRVSGSDKLSPGRNYKPNQTTVGIDIYARWRGQTEDEKWAQLGAGFNPERGHLGYLREAYHGEPYVTRYLVSEAFHDDGANISAATLRERLTKALKLAEERERRIYGATSDDAIRPILQSYTAFVELCEKMERETGEAVHIVASWQPVPLTQIELQTNTTHNDANQGLLPQPLHRLVRGLAGTPGQQRLVRQARS